MAIQPLNVSPTNHILYKYADKYEFLQVALTFLKKGLDMNEVIMIVTDQFSTDYIKKEMEKQWHVDIDDLEEKNQLIIKKTKEWYYPDNSVESKKLILKWKETTYNALKDGRTGLRVIGDADGFFKDGMSSDLISYESQLEKIFDFPFTAVCAYNQSSFSELGLEEQKILLDHHHSLIETQN